MGALLNAAGAGLAWGQAGQGGPPPLQGARPCLLQGCNLVQAQQLHENRRGREHHRHHHKEPQRRLPSRALPQSRNRHRPGGISQRLPPPQQHQRSLTSHASSARISVPACVCAFELPEHSVRGTGGCQRCCRSVTKHRQFHLSGGCAGVAQVRDGCRAGRAFAVR